MATATDSKPKRRVAGYAKTFDQIMRSLQVRNFTKKLLMLLQMRDKDGLEQWLLSESIDSIGDAIKDLGDWPDQDAEKVHRQIFELVSDDRFATLLTMREGLQAVVVDMLIAELQRKQEELRKSKIVPFCKADHPLWECSRNYRGGCDVCKGKSSKAPLGVHFKCVQCQITFCQDCINEPQEKRRSLVVPWSMPNS